MDSSLGEGKILLPRDIEELIFFGSGLRMVSLADGFLMLNNAKYVKKCEVSAEDEIECVIRLSSTEEQQSRGVPFQSLEKLLLRCLRNFIGLFMWEGKAAVAPLLPGIFTQLTVLEILSCNKMKKLIPRSLLQTLPNLQNLKVRHCEEIEEIIGDEDDDGSPVINSSAEVTMPRLKKLELVDLPKLKSICKGRIAKPLNIIAPRFNRFKNYISQALKIGISKESDEKKRAVELFQAVKNKGKFVLILDDVSKQIDTENIGILLGMDGCKVVITSRSLEVFHRMGFQKIIKVNTFSEKESWELFLKKLDHVELSPEVEEICKKMTKRCSGLPLALVTLAGSMRGMVDIHEWRDASEELDESCMGQADMENGVLPILVYAFNRLKDPKLKSCFLYCSLFPEDYDNPRDELIANFISEELMDTRSSRRAEFDQGHAILNKLEKACLVEIWTDREVVRMHNLIRDMALTITKHNPMYMVKVGLELTEIPKIQNWTKDLDKISLMDNSIHDISPDTQGRN
ncbi:putative disease resistance protein-like [Forsythia ovata]|uniref:Disease resistance protein-like n=1 Tax=Forsythia ovata TaxID=205694 RepID=A0ABD1V175_9LAMI